MVHLILGVRKVCSAHQYTHTGAHACWFITKLCLTLQKLLCSKEYKAHGPSPSGVALRHTPSAARPLQQTD